MTFSVPSPFGFCRVNKVVPGLFQLFPILSQGLVGACLAGGNMISRENCDRVSNMCFAILCWICWYRYTKAKNERPKMQ